MFEHSIKVPRLYKSAAKIVERVKLQGESVKQVYDDKFKHRNLKALYALIVSTVQNDSNLELLLTKSELLRKETRLDPWLAKVLITELLWGKKRLPGNSKPVQTIISYQTSFNLHINDLEQPRNCREKVDKPRYVRVNTLKISVNEAIDAFTDEGWVLVKKFEDNDYPKFLSKISNLVENEFMVDLHVPYLLIFPPRTEFYNHNAYRNGLIALQDKASCLPAHILNPSPDSKVLDMCAAPGMKTTQLACIINGSGVIYAVERDIKRAEILRNMIQASGAEDCVQVVIRDVLDVCKRKNGLVLAKENDGKFKEENNDEKTDKDNIYREADYILVDPSCSGSGMVEGHEREDAFRTNKDRLKKLAGFQIMILKHALRSFPSAKRVVYSTCSLNVEENEEVVREVLQSAQHFKLVDVKMICKPWTNFGSDTYGDIGRFCLYSKPVEDLTHGFFVAVFDRLEIGEENMFLLKREHHFLKNSSKISYEKFEKDNEESDSLTKTNENKRKTKKSKKNNYEHDEEVFKSTTKPLNDRKNDSKCLEHESLPNTCDIKLKKKKKKCVTDQQSSDISHELQNDETTNNNVEIIQKLESVFKNITKPSNEEEFKSEVDSKPLEHESSLPNSREIKLKKKNKKCVKDQQSNEINHELQNDETTNNNVETIQKVQSVFKNMTKPPNEEEFKSEVYQDHSLKRSNSIKQKKKKRKSDDVKQEIRPDIRENEQLAILEVCDESCVKRKVKKEKNKEKIVVELKGKKKRPRNGCLKNANISKKIMI